MSLFKSFSRHATDKQPTSSASTSISSQPFASTPAATAATPAESEPLRADGSDKYYGMENFGNTCYCNSVVQALFYTKPFRDAVINYPRNNVSPPPPRPEPETTTTTSASTENTPAASITDQQSTASTQPLSTVTSPNPNPPSLSTPKGLTKTKSNSMFSRGKLNRTNSSDPTDLAPTSPVSPPMRSNPSFSAQNGVYGLSLSPTPVPANPYAPSPYSLNGAIASTSIIAQNAQKDPNAPPPLPSIPLDYSRNDEYGMKESLFTCLKDLFERIVGENGKSGIIAPTKLVEVLKRENVLFEGNTHQDAHEFLNYLLNDVVESVDRYEKSRSPDGLSKARWVHELFEGILTSETKCLTCENMTTRDEVFLDLSIDIEQNSSVSACLRQFSASEMLCERNKFHCDICGGLQEAEKRMKVKKSPKILALHLKRFKYTEDMQRNLKLFHRVVYPPTLRLFNTTDDAEDPDRMYELYAVVVHIGGGPYHGHYVTIVKNDATGKWMLIDDEAVEAVDDGFVGRFYGDRPGMASAYVLFYQQVDQKPIEPMDAAPIPNGKVSETAAIANGVAKMDINEKRPINGHSSQNSLDSLSRVPSSPAVSRVPTKVTSLATVEEKSPQIPAQTTPPASPVAEPVTPMTTTPSVVTPSKSSNLERTPTKKELKDSAKREKEERKEREKREKEEGKKDTKKLKSGFGTIKRWTKDKDKS